MSTTKNARLIEAVIKKIEQRYAIGREILEQCGPTSPHGMIAQLAERYKINRDSAQKLRAMANPEIGYTKRELQAWFKQFRKHGHALSISHFVRLISVPKGKTRDQLTRDALEKKWSGHRLQVEVLTRQGRRQEGGRRPTVISGDAFLGELEQTMWAWSRWLDLHLEANPELPVELARQLRALKSKISRVNELLEQRV
ncbi:MAG: hypothetical protein FJY60_06170 [Betaproteobacteria bacterium]|nr:hypothetical protein [Betaproteobacteria bacterium]